MYISPVYVLPCYMYIHVAAGGAEKSPLIKWTKPTHMSKMALIRVGVTARRQLWRFGSTRCPLPWLVWFGLSVRHGMASLHSFAPTPQNICMVLYRYLCGLAMSTPSVGNHHGICFTFQFGLKNLQVVDGITGGEGGRYDVPAS